MRVLVGVDGSSNSLATVAFVGKLLAVDRDELILCYVAPATPMEVDDQLDPGVVARAESGTQRRSVRRGRLADGARVASACRARGNQRFRRRRLARRSPRIAKSIMIAVGFRGAGTVRAVHARQREPGGRAVGDWSRCWLSKAIPASSRRSTIRCGRWPRTTAPEMGARIAGVDRSELPGRRGASGWVMTVVPPMFVAELPDWLKPITRDDDVRAMAEAWQNEHQQQLAQSGQRASRLRPASARVLPPERADRRPRASGRKDSGNDSQAADRPGRRRQSRPRRRGPTVDRQHVGRDHRRSTMLGARRA